MSAPTFPLCDDCYAECHRWSIYRMPSPPIRLITIGSTAAHVLDARRQRVDDHYAFIRRQQALVAESCRRDHRVQGKDAS